MPPREDNRRLSTQPIRIRERWASPYEFILTILGYSVGLGNMWRFPYLCYQNGGGTFVVCYCIAELTVGIPYFFLELALGQHMQSGALGIWRICPLFKGVGWAMMVINCYSNIYYIVILAWATFYLFSSFRYSMPWEGCKNDWNTEHCVPASCTSIKCSPHFLPNETVSSVTEFWENRLLQITDGLENIGSLQWELVGSLFLMWTCCYFCLWKGIRWTGKIVYVTVGAPYLLILIVLIRACFLDGAGKGMLYFITPKFENFLNSKVWFEAFGQVLYSLGVGYGTLAALGSYNDYYNNLHRQMLVAAVVELLTSIFIGLAVFGVLGYMAHIQSKSIEKVVKSGPELAFIVYPTAVLLLPVNIIWALVFFLIIITIGIDSEFCCIEGIITALLDEFRNFIKDQRELLVLAICLLKFLIGLIFVAKGGMYVFQMVDTYAVAGWSILTTVLIEGAAISYVYGIKNFYLDLEVMFGFKPPLWWMICWFAVSPILVIVVIIGELMQHEMLIYHSYVYPLWANVIGWILSLSSILCIPSYMIYCLIKTEGGPKQRLQKSVRPTYKLVTPKLTPADHPEVLEMQAMQANILEEPTED